SEHAPEGRESSSDEQQVDGLVAEDAVSPGGIPFARILPGGSLRLELSPGTVSAGCGPGWATDTADPSPDAGHREPRGRVVPGRRRTGGAKPDRSAGEVRAADGGVSDDPRLRLWLWARPPPLAPVGRHHASVRHRLQRRARKVVSPPSWLCAVSGQSV